MLPVHQLQFIPDGLDVLQLARNLELLVGNLDDFFNVVRVILRPQLYQRVQRKGRVRHVNGRVGFADDGEVGPGNPIGNPIGNCMKNCIYTNYPSVTLTRILFDPWIGIPRRL